MNLTHLTEEGKRQIESDIVVAGSILEKLPQVNTPLTHKFAPGVYLREIFMPAGTFVIGKIHKTEHFNIVLSGKAKVLIDGEPVLIDGPCTFTSKAGTRKVLLIIEDMRWCTAHPTDLIDIGALEDSLVEKPEPVDVEQYMKLLEAAS